jgi:hypothetical protein
MPEVSSKAVEAAMKDRVDQLYGRREWESWDLDKRAEATGFVRAEVEQAYRVVGSTIRAELLGEVREQLLDDDSPILLAIRDAVGDEIEGDEDWRWDGERPHPNDPCIEGLGDSVSDAARKALVAALATLSDEGATEEPTGECLVAMSGPTCMDPNCPPCRHPEMQAADCEGPTDTTEGGSDAQH